MDKLVINVSEGSNVLGVYSDAPTTAVAYVTTENVTKPEQVEIVSNPEIITAAEVALSFTSEDLDDAAAE